MDALISDPREVHRLRAAVFGWLPTAVVALNRNRGGPARKGFFQSHSYISGDDETCDITTTGRAYAALMRVDQTVGLERLRILSGGSSDSVDWLPLEVEDLVHFVDLCGKASSGGGVVQHAYGPPLRSRLDIARLADMFLAAKYFSAEELQPS